MAATTPKPAEDSISPASLFGRDEMNLAELPIALVADRVPKGQKTLYFEDNHGRLTVTGSDAYGLPTATDTDVIVVLLYLTKKSNDFKDDKVNFSRYEIIDLLGWPDQGWSYKRLDESLNCWHGVSLHYDGCWWNNRLKCFTDMKMHIIDTIELITKDIRKKAYRAGQPELPLSWFRWNKEFIESCQADNLRQLDLDTYFSLKSAVSKRLYRFLGKRFYRQADWTFDLNEIAFERVGLSRSYADAGKIKEKLQPAIEELESIGFLRLLSPEKRYRRIDRGQWTIRLIRQSPTLVMPQPSAPPAASQPPPLIAELISRGVTAKSAAELVKKHPAESIQLKIDVFDWLMEKQDKRVAKSPEGYLVKSISDDYKAPRGFVSAAERRKQQEAKVAKEQADAADRRRKQEADAQERREKELVIGFWDGLSKEQHAEHEAAAIAQADAESLKLLEAGPMKKYGMTIIRHSYARKLLQSQGKLPPAEA